MAQVRSFPDDPRAVAALAMAHDLAHDDAGLTICWRRCLELDPNDLRTYSDFATRLANRGDYEEAEKLLRQAMRVRGAPPSFADYLALLLTDQGKFPEAARVLEDSLARQSPTANTHAQLGEVYRQLKEFPKAKEQFEKAIQMDRSSSRAYYGLGQALVRLGANQEAEKVLAEFKRLKDSEKQAARKRRDDPAHHPEDKQIAPRLVAQILTLAAKVHFSHEEADIAEKHLRRAAKLVPNDTSCRQELADLYTTSGRLEEAVATVEDLRRIEPRNPVHLRTLGVLQARLRRWDAAEGTFRELCRARTGQRRRVCGAGRVVPPHRQGSSRGQDAGRESGAVGAHRMELLHPGGHLREARRPRRRRLRAENGHRPGTQQSAVPADSGRDERKGLRCASDVGFGSSRSLRPWAQLWPSRVW